MQRRRGTVTAEGEIVVSDTAEQVQKTTSPVATVEHAAPTPVLVDSGGSRASAPTTTSVAQAARRSAAPGTAFGSDGRIERGSAIPPDPDAPSAAVSRIQRSTNLGARAESAPIASRIQRTSADVVIQRDLSDVASKVGGAVSGAASAVGSAMVGAKNALVDGAKSVGNAAADTAVGIAKAVHRSDFNDLNATQFLVSAGGQIEAINRRDEDGAVVYYKTGSVDRGDGERPTITPYDQAFAMPTGWLPSVTHINGMMVKPNEGLGSALRLQAELEAAGGNGALLGADVPSVLYTYSAHRGFVTDLAECVWGKLYQDDDATDRQTQIMLDAVANQQRTTVSAHSRGTIKTDNAVRTAHAQISGEHLPAALADPAVHQLAVDAAKVESASSGMGLSASMLVPVYEKLFARQKADQMATADMDQYVQLIYAGNAVQFPSGSVNLQLVVAGFDPVAFGVGKYYKFATGNKTEMTEVEGGHGFDDNYAATVAGLIMADLEAQQ